MMLGPLQSRASGTQAGELAVLGVQAALNPKHDMEVAMTVYVLEYWGFWAFATGVLGTSGGAIRKYSCIHLTCCPAYQYPDPSRVQRCSSG